MKIDEKLRHFTTVVLEATQKECDESYENYKKKMDDYYEEHKIEAIKHNKELEKIETDKIKRMAAKDYSIEQMRIRKDINKTREGLTNKLIEEVRNLLLDFCKTNEYKELLLEWIAEAKKVARGEVINIYIDQKDEEYLEELSKKSGEKLLLSAHSFGGGIRAEIPKKNILVDKSFESKMEEIFETRDIWSDKKLV